MPGTKTPGDWILTTTGTDSAAAAAMLLLARPGARLFLSSRPSIAWSLASMADEEPKAASLHVCGVGIFDEQESEVLDALSRIRSHRVRVYWYCGRGYLDSMKASLGTVCNPVFLDAESNTEAVFRHLRLAGTDTTSRLLHLAREFVARTPVAPDHAFWHDLLEAAAVRYLKFGESEPYLRAIHKLAGLAASTRADEREVAHFRTVKPGPVSLGSSALMRRLRASIRTIADIDEPVLVTGPSGAGKELVARSLHEGSRRREGPFVPVNCAVLSTSVDLAHDRLFGHIAGAFTGAQKVATGAFEEASGGTLFLDEVAELPLPIQTQLLRVLEEKTITRLGSLEPRPVDVRVVAATNQDLRSMMARRSFRLDLYYRLDVLTLDVPPLRDRLADARSIADSVERDLSARGCSLALTRDDWKAVHNFDWPGNIRQFVNLLKRSAYMSVPLFNLIQKEMAAHRPEKNLTDEEARALRLACPPDPASVLPEARIRRFYMEHVLNLYRGNWAQAAKALGVSPTTLRSWLGDSRRGTARARRDPDPES